MQSISTPQTPAGDSPVKRTVVIVAGILFTIGVGINMNRGQDWSAGAGQTPRDMMLDYFELAYGQGKGGDASSEYFAPDAVDNVPNAADRKNGAPAQQEIHDVIADGRQVAVHHTIARADAAPQQIVDIYTVVRGKVVRRERITGAGE